MLNEPRVYKNSPFMFVFLVLIFGILFFVLFFGIESENLMMTLPLMLLFGIVFLFFLFSSTSQTTKFPQRICLAQKRSAGARSAVFQAGTTPSNYITLTAM
jgi:hypothetical protein